MTILAQQYSNEHRTSPYDDIVAPATDSAKSIMARSAIIESKAIGGGCIGMIRCTSALFSSLSITGAIPRSAVP